MAGCGFNPLSALNPWSPDFNIDAGLMAEALIPMSGNEKNPFFPLSARALVGGLIMFEVCKAKEQNRAPLLANVRRMICEAAQPETPAKMMGGVVIKEAIPAKGIPAYAKEMANSFILGMRNKGGQFVDWNKSTVDVAKTAMAETEFLDDMPMALNLARDDFRFNEVKERPTTVYLCLPMKVMKRHGKWLRIMLTAAIQACMRPRADTEPSTLFILNEFAAMGHLQLIEDNFTVVRGAGIQMMPVLQDLGQMKELYKERWETFIANSDVTATFAPNDLTTAKWFSERCGETVKPKTTVTENWAQNSGTSQKSGHVCNRRDKRVGHKRRVVIQRTANHSLEKVPAVTTADLYSMDPGEMRIIMAGEADTISAHALPYWEMKNTVARLAYPNPYGPNPKLVRLPQTSGRQAGSFFQGSSDKPGGKTYEEAHASLLAHLATLSTEPGSGMGKPFTPNPFSPSDGRECHTGTAPIGRTRTSIRTTALGINRVTVPLGTAAAILPPSGTKAAIYSTKCLVVGVALNRPPLPRHQNRSAPKTPPSGIRPMPRSLKSCQRSVNMPRSIQATYQTRLRIRPSRGQSTRKAIPSAKTLTNEP